MPLDNITTKIEITYSTQETQQLGVNIGDQFLAYAEYNLKPGTEIKVYSNKYFFEKNIYLVEAINCQHDEDSILLVNTCKLVKE